MGGGEVGEGLFLFLVCCYGVELAFLLAGLAVVCVLQLWRQSVVVDTSQDGWCLGSVSSVRVQLFEVLCLVPLAACLALALAEEEVFWHDACSSHVISPDAAVGEFLADLDVLRTVEDDTTESEHATSKAYEVRVDSFESLNHLARLGG